MALNFPNFNEVLVLAYEAVGNGDVGTVTSCLLNMSLIVNSPGLPSVEVDRRLEEYGRIREMVPDYIAVQTPDMVKLVSDWKEILGGGGGSTGGAAAFLHQQLVGGRFPWLRVRNPWDQVFEINGVPKQRDLWANSIDFIFRDPRDPWRNVLGWRILYAESEPLFFPGDHRGVAVTSSLLGGEQALEIGVEGEVCFGYSARAFLPAQIRQVKQEGQFFYFEDSLRFDVEIAKLFARIRVFRANFVCLMLGPSDLQEAISMGLTEDQVFSRLWSALLKLRSKLCVKIFFCGFIPVGSAEVQALVESMHLRLFGNRAELSKDHDVVFFDCASPAPAAASRVYQDDGDLSVDFRATALFAMSRVISLSFHNLVSPLPWQAPGAADRLRAAFWNRRRARIV